MASNILVKWTNRYSKEQGYVAKVRSKKGYFENTYEQSKAKRYLNTTMAQNDIKILNSIGEGDNNDFEVVVL